MNCSNYHIKRLIVFAIPIIFSRLFAQNPDFSIIINVRGGGNDYDLTVGFSPEATDGYDYGLDQYAPPQPPSPAFDAALLWENDRYYTQIVNGDSLDLIEHVWDIQLQFPEDNLITLSWDKECMALLGTFFLQDGSVEFIGINVDMVETDSLLLDNPTFNLLKLKITPKIPVNPPEEFISTSNPLAGVFLGTVTINGLPAEKCDWIAAFDEDGNCAGAAEILMNLETAYINLQIYGNDPTTPEDDGMDAGEDFFLKLWDSSNDLIIDYPEPFSAWYNNNGGPMTGYDDPYFVFNFFANNYYTVLVTANPEDGGTVTGSAAYEENSIVTVVATVNDGYTFVNWTEYGLEVAIEAIFFFTITGNRNLVANFEEIVSTVPVGIVLPVNYPNPVITSSTEIMFELEEPSHVEITVVDLFGNEVRRLTYFAENGSFIWNTLNEAGFPVSSGLYLYQIKSDSEIQNGKMIILR